MQVTVKTATELTFKDLKVGQLFVPKDQLNNPDIDKVGLYLKDDHNNKYLQGVCVVCPLDKHGSPVKSYIRAGNRCAYGDDSKVLLATVEHITVTEHITLIES